MFRKTRKGRSGFSLIEMLVVVFIIMVLVGILMTALGKGSEQARRTLAGQMLDSISQAVTAYKMALEEIPPSDIDGTVAGNTFGVSNGDLGDYDGGELLTQALIGPLRESSGSPTDGKDGPGWVHRSHAYGPYLERVEDEYLYRRPNRRWALQSPGTLQPDRPILYYAAQPNAREGRFNTADVIWGPNGRFDTDHNTDMIPVGEDPVAYWNTDASDTDRRAFEMSLRSNNYLLVTVGDNGVYGDRDNLQRVYK